MSKFETFQNDKTPGKANLKSFMSIFAVFFFNKRKVYWEKTEMQKYHCGLSWLQANSEYFNCLKMRRKELVIMLLITELQDTIDFIFIEFFYSLSERI